MLKKIIKRIDTVAIICLVIATFLFSLTIYKAYNTSFTHDESYTYNHYVKSSLKTTVLFQNNPTANNHILNTLLMAVFDFMFGNSELALRFPNIIAHFLFLLFSYKILRTTIYNNVLIVLSYLIINLNPYLLDFFSLARGYGLSTSFILISIYYLLRFTDSNKTAHYSKSLLFAALATYSNISSLYFFCGLILTYNLIVLNNYKKRLDALIYFFKINKLSFIYILILALTIGYPIYILSINNQFYYGGSNNFWDDTIKSLIYSSLYGKPYNGFGEHIVKAIFLITTISIAFSLYKKSSLYNPFSKLLIVAILIMGAILTINAQHYLLGSKFIVGRTALFLVPTFALCFCLLLNDIFKIHSLRIIAVPKMSIVMSLVMLHTINSYSLKKFSDWDYDRNTKDAIQILELEINNQQHGNIKLGINWLFEPTINYYIETRKIERIEKVNRNGLNNNQDYFYIFESDTSQLKGIKYNVIHRFNDTNTILAKKM